MHPHYLQAVPKRTPFAEIVTKAAAYYPQSKVMQARYILSRQNLEEKGQHILQQPINLGISNQQDANPRLQLVK